MIQLVVILPSSQVKHIYFKLLKFILFFFIDSDESVKN